MDWDALMPAGETVGTVEGQEAGKLFPPVPNNSDDCSRSSGNDLSIENKSLGDLFPLFPMFPQKNEGRQCEALGIESPGAAGGPVQLRARNEKRGGSFPLHPAAVVLLLAWCVRVGVNRDERLSALEALAAMSPAEQVREWHGRCIERGLKPWELIFLEAPAEAVECGKCRHLVSRHFALGDSRRQFHWGCALGYLVHEFGRGSERIWIAPPECGSYERWYPTAQR